MQLNEGREGGRKKGLLHLWNKLDSGIVFIIQRDFKY